MMSCSVWGGLVLLLAGLENVPLSEVDFVINFLNSFISRNVVPAYVH